MIDQMSRSWKGLAARGSVAAAVGIVAIAWPVSTAAALALLWGTWALAEGVAFVGLAVQPFPTRVRASFATMGTLAISAAFCTIVAPSVAASTLTRVLGIWLIARALSEVFGSLLASRPVTHRLLLLGAAIDVLLGAMFLSHPGTGSVGIALLLGVAALAWGAVYMVLAHSVKDLTRVPADPGPRAVVSADQQ